MAPLTRRSRLQQVLNAASIALVLTLAGSALASPGGPKGGGGGGGGGKKTDATPPTVAFVSPSDGATVSGPLSISGTASDNTQLARIDVSVDGGAYQPASGTSAWTYALDSTAYPDGSHTVRARASDAAGNTALATLSVTVRNSVSIDATPPAVAIAVPSSGSSVSGDVSVSGSASDNGTVAKVEVSVDGGSYSPAQGTATWRYTLDTTSLPNGAHTVAARATDEAGNVASALETVSVQNTTSLGAPVVRPSMAAGTLGGFAFQDLNRDGVFETGEQPLADQHLFLYDAGGTYLGNSYTDATGWYQFDNLPDGGYRVQFAPASWWAIRQDWVPDTTGSLFAAINVQLTASASADFGWRAIVRSTDPNAPFSSYVGTNGLRVKSYDDVIPAKTIYDRLMSGLLIGPEARFTTVRFDFAPTGSTSTTASATDGLYTSYAATSNVSFVSWLDGDDGLFHEYGHAWSLYNAYIVQQDPTLAAYLRARGLAGDPRVGTSYAWSLREMIAEDYRQLFGTPSARAVTQMNRDIPNAKDVPGLAAFLSGSFTAPLS
ncbi:MAG TPA: Ig-like domain-containing protein [Gaiellaceae bacterium]|nr:Ig-like domain-containing protein [Gaiellaceae bacterium]